MSASNDGGSTAGLGGVSLEEFIGDAFGDVMGSSVEESSGSVESPGSNAGAPPAPSSDPSAAPPEGAPSAEHAGDPPAVAAAASPDPAAPVAQPTGDPDPLAGATPLTYTVNGETRTFDGIRVLGEHGAVIPAEHLQKLTQRLSERDHLFEQNQQRHQAFQSLERLTSWTVKDAQGERVLTGPQAMAERNAVTAKAIASLRVMSEALSDEKKFLSLLTVVDDGNGNQRWGLDQTAVANLLTQAELASVRAEQTARAHIATLATPQPQSAPQEQPIAAIAPVTVDAQLKALSLTVPPDSRQFLIEQLPLYVRPTTPAERAADPTLGARIVDGSFLTLVRREAKATAATKAVAEAAGAANRSNAAALAAAARGVRGNAPGRPNAPAAPAEQKKDPQSEMWARRERAAAGAF